MSRTFSSIIVILTVLGFALSSSVLAQTRPKIRTRVPVMPTPKTEVEDWKEFSSDKLNLKVMFPKKSETSETDEIDETTYGTLRVRATNVHAFINQNFYLLSVKRYPTNFLRDQTRGAEGFAAWMKDLVLKEEVIISEKLSRVWQYPMAEFVYRSSGEEVVVHRVIVIEDTLHQLLVQLHIPTKATVESTLEKNQERLSKFFDSFQLTGKSVLDKTVEPVTAQPPAPPPIAKATPADVSEKSEEQISAEIVESVKKPVAWKQRSLPGFAISVEMPRDTIRQTETFYETGLGRLQMVLHLSVSEAAVFIVGRYTLPYSVTNEKVLRDLYRSFSSGLSEDGVQFQHVKDFDFEGNLGVEMRSLPEDIRYQPAKSRAFVRGRDVYIMLAMPSENEDEHEPPEKSLIDSRTAEFDRFFGSVSVAAKAAQPVSKESPMFSSSWKDGRFTSNHFRFSYEPPKGWIMISQNDVEDLRNWGRRVISEEAGRSLPQANQRRNLATFISAPLGTDGVAMIAFNLGVASNSFEDARKLAAETQRLLSGLSNYKIVKRPYETTLGTAKAILMQNIVTVTGMTQEQHIFYFLRNDYVLGLTITCAENADCASALESFSSLDLSSK